MLIDWVTARIPLEALSPAAREAALALGDHISRYCPKSGEVMWTTSAWDSVRSDSHQIAAKCGTDLWVQGAPGRVIGDGDTVFSSGPAATLDLVGCVDLMVRFLGARLGVALPAADQWLVSRIDVTGNVALQSLAEVRQALSILRDVEGGRYRVSQQKGDTVYWSHGSKHRSGKAYAKGPHLVHLMKQKTYTGRRYSASDIAAAERLLRLELKLAREYLSRNSWLELKPADLRQEWESYFGRMLGGIEVMDTQTLEQRIFACAKTEGQGRAALGCWVMIQQIGWERAQDMFSRPTWYRHLQVLRAAGLGDADISKGQIVQLRRRALECYVATGWQDIAA